MMQQNISPVILTWKQTQLLIRVIMMRYVNQSIIRLYQTYENKYLGKGSGWFIDSVKDHVINFSKWNPLACRSYISFLR